MQAFSSGSTAPKTQQERTTMPLPLGFSAVRAEPLTPLLAITPVCGELRAVVPAGWDLQQSGKPTAKAAAAAAAAASKRANTRGWFTKLPTR